MKTNVILIILIIFAGIAFAGVVIYKQSAVMPPIELAKAPVATPQPSPTPAPTPAETKAALPPAPKPTPAISAPVETPAAAAAEKAPQKTQPRGGAPRASAYQPPTGPIGEAEGRTALAFVGADPQAEKVWMAAINDPSLPNNARQNLIEDLNEDGISDPDHPTMEDLPLIQSRLALIEQIGDGAMDDVNYAAFQEAYKDLTNMANKLTGN